MKASETTAMPTREELRDWFMANIYQNVMKELRADCANVAVNKLWTDVFLSRSPVKDAAPAPVTEEMHAKCLRLIEQRIEHAKWGAVPKDIQTAADVAMALIGLAAPQPQEKV